MRVEEWLKDQPGLFEEIYAVTPSLTFIQEFTPDTIQMYYEMRHSQRQITSKFEGKTTTQLARMISIMYSQSWTKVINEFSRTYKLGTDVTRRFVDDTTSMVNRDLTTNGKSKMSPYNSTEDYVGSSSQEDLMTDKTSSVIGHTSDDKTTTLDAVVRYRELFADTVLIDRVFEDINDILTLSVYGTTTGTGYSVAYPSQGAPSSGGTGADGAQGPPGPKGEKGPIGPQGPAGPKGEDGTDGAMTFEELTPAQTESLRGPAGPAGIEGPEGPQGIQGVQGLPGDRGETGLIGPEGPQGIQGKIGPQGLQGIQGVTGAVGPAPTWVTLTQAAYNAIVTKDPNTVYLVVKA